MLPLVGIRVTTAEFLQFYRKVFRKEAGFKHISRYINGLLMSPKKTRQGIYSQLVWNEGEQVSRRGMHEAVFEAGSKHQELMKQHRRVLAPIHQGKGREIIALDWTFSYHPYSEKIFAAQEAYDYVNRCWSSYQTVVTASVSNAQRVDGIAVEVQHPNYEKEEFFRSSPNNSLGLSQLSYEMRKRLNVTSV
jgi:hypothetical protein